MTLYELVERERRHVRGREVMAGALLVGCAAALIISLGAGVLGGARWLALPRVVPFIVWAFVLAAAGALAWRTRRRLHRDATRAQVAHAIEAEQQLRRGALLGALELEGRGALAARAATAARGTLPDDGALAPELRRAGHKRAVVAAGAAVAAGLVLVSATPLFGDGLRVVFRPIDAWRGALLARPAIDSAPSDLIRGAPVRLIVRAPGRQRVMLAVRQTGEAWHTDTLRVDPATGAARWKLDALRGDLHLVATDGRASSDSVVIHAADRPFLGAVALHVVYPAYLGRSSENLPVGEPLRIPRGTLVDVSGRASVALASVSLTPESGQSVSLTANGHAFAGRFMADHSTKMRWMASGSTGPVTDLPAALELEVQPDSAPRVEITAPTGDTVLAADGVVGLGIQASDDHGIAQLGLRIARIGATGDAPATDQPIANAVGTTWVGTASVDVGALQLQPGNSVRVHAEAVDASPWTQKGVSRDLIIKRPTVEESRVGARQLGDSMAKEARAAAAAQKSLAQRTDEASRAQSRNGGSQGSQGQSSRGSEQSQSKSGMSYENAEKARSLAQEQRQMADRVQKLRQSTQQLEQQLKAAGALDSSLARQLSEAQALLRQAMTPEMMAQMQKLENASKDMDADRSRDAMRDLAQMQQRLKEQLERSAEMLKRAAAEGAMQTLADEAKELSAKERALADSDRSAAQKNQQQPADNKGQSPSDAKKGESQAGDKKDDAARAREAQELAERSQRLRDAMQELKDRLAKDDAKAGANKTGQAQEHASNSESGMRRASEKMREQNGDKNGQKNGEKNAEKKNGEKSAEQRGQQKAGDQRGQPKAGDQRGQQKAGDQRGAKSGEQAGEQSGHQNGQQQSGEQEARRAADEMQAAAQSMQDARQAQVADWKKELTSELDQSVQEMMQLSRQERALEQQARGGSQNSQGSQGSQKSQGSPKSQGSQDSQDSQGDRRSAQSAVEQGVDQANERIQGAGKKSALLSPRSQRAMAEAKQKVQQATQSMGQSGSSGSQQANALGDAADALTKAAASLARDRERANSANSASGFAEMIQQMREMAQKQGQINSQAQGLMGMPQGASGGEGQSLARQLARQQRTIADQLEDAGDGAGGDRAAQLAREARQLADALDNGRLDATTLARQQQLFRRLLDAGRSLEKDERDDSGKREATSAKGDEVYTPTGAVDTKAAIKFRPPTWQEMRGLSADERRAILDYFTRINSAPAP
jgi:hypothetical protein